MNPFYISPVLKISQLVLQLILSWNHELILIIDTGAKFYLKGVNHPEKKKMCE